MDDEFMTPGSMFESGSTLDSRLFLPSQQHVEALEGEITTLLSTTNFLIRVLKFEEYLKKGDSGEALVLAKHWSGTQAIPYHLAHVLNDIPYGHPTFVREHGEASTLYTEWRNSMVEEFTASIGQEQMKQLLMFSDYLSRKKYDHAKSVGRDADFPEVFLQLMIPDKKEPVAGEYASRI